MQFKNLRLCVITRCRFPPVPMSHCRCFSQCRTKFFAFGTNRMEARLFASGEDPQEVYIMRTLIASAALVTLLAAPASAQMSGTGQFCLKSSAGSAQCNYQTMAQCEQARPKGSADQCLDKSQISGTTGSGAAAPSTSPSSAPKSPAPPK